MTLVLKMCNSDEHHVKVRYNIRETPFHSIPDNRPWCQSFTAADKQCSDDWQYAYLWSMKAL